MGGYIRARVYYSYYKSKATMASILGLRGLSGVTLGVAGAVAAAAGIYYYRNRKVKGTEEKACKPEPVQNGTAPFPFIMLTFSVMDISTAFTLPRGR